MDSTTSMSRGCNPIGLPVSLWCFHGKIFRFYEGDGQKQQKWFSAYRYFDNLLCLYYAGNRAMAGIIGFVFCDTADLLCSVIIYIRVYHVCRSSDTMKTEQ